MLGTGQLIYENDIGKWCIPAVLFDGPVMLPKKPDDRKITYQHADVAFVCEQPFWQSFVEYSTMIIGRTGGLSFPLAFPVHFSDLADNIEINNTGDVDAPLRIEFRGPAAGCRITKVETGEYIEVSYTLAAGEKLIIDTDPRSTTVTFVDTHGVSVSAFNKINALSTFFQLTRGINTIAFTSVSGTPEVYLYWHELFSGV
jgi:phage-related protein